MADAIRISRNYVANANQLNIHSFAEKSDVVADKPMAVLSCTMPTADTHPASPYVYASRSITARCMARASRSLSPSVALHSPCPCRLTLFPDVHILVHVYAPPQVLHYPSTHHLTSCVPCGARSCYSTPCATVRLLAIKPGPASPPRL